jgi:hypothetical protein
MNLTTRKVARTFARVRLLADRVKLVFPSSCARRQPRKGISPIVRTRTFCRIAPCRAEDVGLFLYLLGYQFLNEKPQNHLPYHIDELRRLRLQPQDWRWPSAATIMPHTPKAERCHPVQHRQGQFRQRPKLLRNHTWSSIYRMTRVFANREAILFFPKPD